MNIKKMMANLENAEHQTQDVILENQAHIVNHKRLRLLNQSGLRQIILTRNKLGDRFAESLQQALCYDKYVKSIDVAGNRIGTHGLKSIIKLALMENSSIVAFDARLNPGCSEKVERQLALCMLKNIEKTKEKGLPISPEFLKPELYSFHIPSHILKGLGLLAPGEKPHKIRQKSASRASKRTSLAATGIDRAKSAAMNQSAFEAYNSGQINLNTDQLNNGEQQQDSQNLNRVNVKMA